MKIHTEYSANQLPNCGRFNIVRDRCKVKQSNANDERPDMLAKSAHTIESFMFKFILENISKDDPSISSLGVVPVPSLTGNQRTH